MSDTKKSNKYNACLNIQVGPEGELVVGGKTIKVNEEDYSIVINAVEHTLNMQNGERISKDGKNLKSITPDSLKELRKAVERKVGPNKLKAEQSSKKTHKQGASR